MHATTRSWRSEVVLADDASAHRRSRDRQRSRRRPRGRAPSPSPSRRPTRAAGVYQAVLEVDGATGAGADDRRLGRALCRHDGGRAGLHAPAACPAAATRSSRWTPCLAGRRPRRRAAGLRCRGQRAHGLRGAQDDRRAGGATVAGRRGRRARPAERGAPAPCSWRAGRGRGAATLTAPYGVRSVIRGRLTDAGGAGVRNARIELPERDRRAPGHGARQGRRRGRGPTGASRSIVPRGVSSRTLLLRSRSHADAAVAEARPAPEGARRRQAVCARRAPGRPGRPLSPRRAAGRPPAPTDAQAGRAPGARPATAGSPYGSSARGSTAASPLATRPPRRPHRAARLVRAAADYPYATGASRAGPRPRRSEPAALPFPPPMNRVLVTGGAGTIGAAVVRRLLRDPDFEVRVSDQRPAPDWMREGCEVHTGDLRDARRGARGDARLLARDPPGGDRRRDRELPQAAPHADRGQQRALQRGRARRARPRRRALRLRVELDGLRARDGVPDAPRSTSSTRRSRARPTGSPSSPARSTCARPTTSTASLHDLPPVQRLRPRARCPTTSRASPTWCPTSSASALPRPGPLPIFGDGTQTRTLTHIDDIADGIVTAMASPAGPARRLQHLGADERTVAELAAIIWEACGRDPDEFALEHLPSFEVDVVRRWPSVEKARAPARLGGTDRRARGSRRRWTGCAGRWRRPPRHRLFAMAQVG